MKKIPDNITLGGQLLQVKNVERCDNNAAGTCNLWGGCLEIAEKFDKCEKQSETSKVNTFYHEVTHAILDTMGEKDLSGNERFVCAFAGFLTDAMAKAYFEEEE